MADKFLNLTAVQTIKTWAKGLFAKDADLDTLSSRVDDIVAEGGEPNVIESIKKNGTALTPDANKAVDISVPTVTKSGTGETEKVTVTEGQNSYDMPTVDAMESYVSEHGGVIQKVKYDGTELPIDTTDKSVNVPKEVFIATADTTSGADIIAAIRAGKTIVVSFGGGYIYPCVCYSINTSENSPQLTIHEGSSYSVYMVNGTTWNELSSDSLARVSDIPTVVSDLTNDSGYQTGSDVQSAIASGVASAVKLKGSVASYSALPSTGNQHGDMYDTLDTGKNYVWIEESGVGRWDDYAGTMDLSAYWISTTGQTNTLEAATVAEINAILNA